MWGCSSQGRISNRPEYGVNNVVLSGIHSSRFGRVVENSVQQTLMTFYISDKVEVGAHLGKIESMYNVRAAFEQSS